MSVIEGINEANQKELFKKYEAKYKALADQLRLKIMYELNQRGQVCVCDLTEIVELPQSKLSYHLKILLDADLITREKIGTWNYYRLHEAEVRGLLSEELCCIFYPEKK
ncbi:ArsR/SmtB family transcription factor [Bacillus piscicola]|uniref:ArsR/SmtB family transcription factor n=1 Tax=Bacillus piscicola TaxID=1632684 RepID=UPI001F094249|nr:metalloregulator ArsR/SmtB family transcription factor [Bacillus piscicola]